MERERERVRERNREGGRKKEQRTERREEGRGERGRKGTTVRRTRWGRGRQWEKNQPGEEVR